MSEPVSPYCERAAAGFWAEPVNAVSNAGFALAAVALAWQLWRGGAGRAHWDLWCLVLLIGCIAVGSFLWHTLAVAWAAVADVLPILVFVSLYLVVFLRRGAGWPLSRALLALAVFELANVAVPVVFPGALNGSVGYLPTWAGMAMLAFLARGSVPARVLLSAFAVFTLSIALRSVDQLVCPWLVTGTHPAWHLLNALVLYLAVIAVVSVAAVAPSRRRSIH